MSDVLVVLPVVDAVQGIACLGTALADDSSFGIGAEDILVVDNTRQGDMPLCSTPPDERGPAQVTQYYRDPDGHNLGVARSWNVGVDALLESDAEYLVMLSTSLRFGPALHTTWLEQMRTFWGWHVIESEGHSLHLWAVHRDAFEHVGRFCAGYWPGYLEEIDWFRRLSLSGWKPAIAKDAEGWPNAWVNAMSIGYALHVDELRHTDVTKVECPFRPLNDLYIERWGGEKGAELWERPYGDKPLDYDADACTPVPVLAKRYGITNWW